MGRKCAVPHCYTGYRKCKDKASLYKVPDDDFFLNKWQEAIAREDRPITPKDYVCEKHFNKDDILRKRIRNDVVEAYQRPKLKPDAIPSVFPDLPEFILKMTKKRRKMTTESILDKSTVLTSNNEDKIFNGIKLEPETLSENNINSDEINIKSEIDVLPLYPDEEIDKYDASGVKLYSCEECSYKTKFPHNLRTHKVKHLSGEDAFMSCEHCFNYKTKWEITYFNHMKSKHGIVLKEKFKCPFCIFRTRNKNFLSKHCYREHGKAESVGIEFKCENEDCDYKTESVDLLNVHILKHDKPNSEVIPNVNTFSCHNFRSNSKVSLESHNKNVHVINNRPNLQETNNIKSICCKECYFTTSSRRYLIAHVRSAHNIGDTIETSKNNILNKYKQQQQKSNQKDKSTFYCSRCPYKSHSQTLIDKHLFKHQTINNTPFICKQCSYIASSENLLEVHQRETFHCNECPYNSKYQSEYIKHTLTHQNTSVDVVQQRTMQKCTLDINEDKNKEVVDLCTVTIKEEYDYL